jgi:hypothetical protein
MKRKINKINGSNEMRILNTLGAKSSEVRANYISFSACIFVETEMSRTIIC